MKKLLMPIKSKREVDLTKSIGILVVAAVVFAIASVIGAQQFSSMIPSRIATLGLAGMGIGMFILIFIGGLFYGWLLQLTMTVLTGKGRYVDGLTAIAYTVFSLSIGAIISSILAYIPIAGMVIAFAVMSIFGVIGYGLIYKLTKMLFETDMITAFVGIAVLIAATLLAFSVTTATGLTGLRTFLPSFVPR